MTYATPSGPVSGVVLFPGAGGGADSAALVAIERGLAPLPVMRRQFANRDAGRSGPERPAAAVAQVAAAVADAAATLGVPTTQIVVGGRSFGGRMASMAVAGEFGQSPLEVGGLLLLSYPLHPPGRPAQLRTEHLGRIEAPTLAVSGDRDPFGTPEELRRELAAIPSVQVEIVPGTHSPRDAPVIAAVLAWLAGMA